MDYKFIEIEKKWQKYWQDNETFKTDVWDFFSRSVENHIGRWMIAAGS